MCTSDDEVGISDPKSEVGAVGTLRAEEPPYEQVLARETTVPFEAANRGLHAQPSLEEYAKYLCDMPGWRAKTVGFIGYSGVPQNAKVLMVAYNTMERGFVEAIANELRKRGAKSVDILTVDEGQDHELMEGEEIDIIIRTKPWWTHPRRYDNITTALNYAQENGYDVLIHGRAGPYARSSPPTGNPVYSFKWEYIPWQTNDEFLSKSTVFPMDLHSLINRKTWEPLYKKGRGARVRVTDPEGTDIEFTLFEKYFDRKGSPNFNPSMNMGHLMAHPSVPLLPEADTTGVMSGTTSHFGSAYPAISVQLDSGRVEEVKGGGRYGDRWRQLREETSKLHYPGFPRTGLFWLNEFAIGTNPKIKRSRHFNWYRSGGFEWERRRSGIIHCGFGTSWQREAELWALHNSVPYGHLHIHLLFPTYEMKTRGGETVKIIENGRLTALDDPEVREYAKKYGDPDELLKEDWIPKIPGINLPGSYKDDYAKNPQAWIKAHG